VKSIIIGVVVVVMVLLTVEDVYSTAADHDYDCDGGGKIILGYLSSYKTSLPCLECF
jgi:hypothetical protein